MPNQRIYELIARRLSGEASAAELDELQSFLREDDEEQFIFEVVHSYWMQDVGVAIQAGASEEDERFRRMLSKSDPVTKSDAVVKAAVSTPDLAIEASNVATSPPAIDAFPSIAADKGSSSRLFSLRRWLAYAATLLLLAGAGYWFFVYYKDAKVISRVADNDVVQNEVVARPGSRSKVILPDGSLVWLNAESRLTYQAAFNSAKREVFLEGEAFFDVAHNEQKPFIVHTSGIDIKVLGTAFNVKSYATDGTIEATLLRGLIEVVKNNDPSSPKVILRPHEKLVFNKADHSVGADVVKHRPSPASAIATVPAISISSLPSNKADSVIKETSWLFDKLNFDGDSFEELAVKMERWFDVDISIKSARLRKIRLKGSFERESVIQALDALMLTTPFVYSFNGRSIVVSDK